MGVLGLSLDDLALLSVYDVLHALKWKQYYQSKMSESQHRNSWEQTRLLAAYMVSPYMKNELDNLTDLFPLDWDEVKQGYTEEDLEKMAEVRRKMDAQVKAEHG